VIVSETAPTRIDSEEELDLPVHVQIRSDGRHVGARGWANVADRFVLGLLGDGFSGRLGQRERNATLPEQLEHIERALITESLRREHGDVTLTAHALGVPKQTLYDKIRRLHIDAAEFRAGIV